MGVRADTGLRLAALALGWLFGTALQLQQEALWGWGAYAVLAVFALLLVAGLGTRAFALRYATSASPASAFAAPMDTPAPSPAAIAAATPAARHAARGSAQRFGAALAAIALAAFSLAGLRAHARLAETLPAHLQGQDLVLTGVVAQLPRIVPEGTRFLFEVESATHAGRAVQLPQLVSLGWTRGWNDDLLMAGPQAELRAGQRWRFTARLRPPHGLMNPQGFDIELWLFEQGIRATGSVRSTPTAVAQRLHDAAGYPVERLRQSVRDAIFLRVGDARAAGVLAALAVGDQSAIERADWDLYRNTGIAHLMSISGLHVTMFAWLAGALVGLAWRRSERLMLMLPAQRAARWGGLLAATAYALLAGWGVPAQRTVWMLATAALLVTFGLRWPWLLVLAAAAVVVSALDPWALLQPGFWLSFVAVGLLMASEPATPPSPAASMELPRSAVSRWLQGRLAAHPPLARLASAAKLGLRTQVIATLGLTPLTLVFFQQVSVVGFIANLIAIPLVTLLVTPLALLGVLLPLLWSAGAALVKGLGASLALLAGVPGAVWSAAAAPLWAQAAGLLAGLLVIAPLPWRVRLLALPLVLPLLAPVVPRPAEGRFEVVAADVGQGSAVLLRTAKHLLVYDTGPAYSRERDAGERVLLPLLRARGEPRIDLLMLTHRDIDHVGGAAALMAALPVALLSSSLDVSHPLRGSGVDHRRCDAGQRWRWDGVDFEVLHPAAADHERTLKPNAVSCVLRVQDAQGASLLLSGDIEAEQERALVESHGVRLKSDLLLVPHHGSKTSSTEAFLDMVQPRAAIVQAGFRSRFGHPAPPVLERYAARGITLVRSDECGAFSWHSGHERPAASKREQEPVCERERRRRYWHHRATTPLP